MSRATRDPPRVRDHTPTVGSDQAGRRDPLIGRFVPASLMQSWGINRRCYMFLGDWGCKVVELHTELRGEVPGLDHQRFHRHSLSMPIQSPGIDLKPVPNQAEHDLELSVVGGTGVGELPHLLELLRFDALVDQQGGVIAVVDDEVGAALGAPVEAPLSAPPVLLEGLPLPGEDGGAIAGDGGGDCVVLGGEDVVGAPVDFSAESSEGLDEDDGLDGHVEGAGDAGTLERLGGPELGTAGHKAGHLDLRKLDLEAAEVRL
ncbi:hypothetical protein Taro_011166 [Colocasia esculenta]|uniref:Uncharacterized protein n=1 Tax=Colocasia esculenta TaxID=4460 RepID=A0A843U5D3_COLES|nr:hypothetical protein [Colocasia esculenta]